MPLNAITSNTLSQFNGSEGLHYIPLFRSIEYTDGVKFLMHNGAGWMVTDMLAILIHEKKVAKEEFVAVKFKKTEKGIFMIYEDGNKKVLYKQEYPNTDFPLDEVVFFCTNKILMLASEY